MPVPSGYYWGVDSAMQMNQSVGGKPSLWEYVTQTTGSTPEFFGRYIGKWAMDDAEVNFLRGVSPGTRILVNYNSPNVGGTRATGRKDALDAIAAATKLKIPDGVAIYANAEPIMGPLSPEWAIGWCETLRPKYTPALYGNNVFVPGQSYLGPVYAALKKALPGVAVPMWAMYPWQKDHITPNEMNFEYKPIPVPAAPDAAQVWQYVTDRYKVAPGGKGVVDMNLATAEGFRLMWKLDPLPYANGPPRQPTRGPQP